MHLVLDLHVLLCRKSIALIQILKRNNALAIAIDSLVFVYAAHIKNIGLGQMLGAIGPETTLIRLKALHADVIGGFALLLHVVAQAGDVVLHLVLQLFRILGDVCDGKQLLNVQLAVADIAVVNMNDVVEAYAAYCK